MTTLSLPLSHRIVKSKERGSRTVTNVISSSRPLVYREYTQDSLDAALSAVERGTSIRHAATLHGVPKSTLQDHASGRVSRLAKSGPKPYLSIAEEEELVSFLIKCSRIGYPHTRLQVISIVQQVVDSKYSDSKYSDSKYSDPPTVTHGWWERFVQRHPNLSLRTPAPLSFVRAMATDNECLNQYFDLLQKTLKDNDIFDKATSIFNCDESGLPLNPKSQKVVVEAGSKNPHHLTGSTKNQITVLACSSAAGYALPPFVVFDRKNLNLKLTEGEVPGTVYGLSSNGWMNSELFTEWFKGHFLYYAPASRPLLLLLDGHKSHYCPEFIRAAALEGVLIFTLPPNTTHICQPLDKGPFSPLKMHWKKVVQDFILKHRGRCVTRYDFSALFADAWSKAMTMKNITAGFRVTGIYPFNREAVLVKKEFTQFQPEDLLKSSGLKFIPLYSPSHLSTPKSSMLLTSPAASSSSVDLSASFSLSEDERPSLYRSFSDSNISAVTPTKELSCFLPVKRGRLLRKFVSTPLPPSKLPANKKSCGKVLTSREQLELLAQKEEKKEEELRQREEKKRIREEKKKAQEEKKKHRMEKKKLKSLTNGMCVFVFTWCNIAVADLEESVQFTEEEMQLFQTRYDNDYDLTHDARYNQWKQFFYGGIQ